MNEIIFVVEDSPEGGYVAKAAGESIFTEADMLDELHAQVRDAVRCHFDESATPKLIRLHFVRDEVITAWNSRGTCPARSLRKRWRESVIAPRARPAVICGSQPPSEHHVTIAVQDSLKVGTLAAILADVAADQAISRDELLDRLFG